MNSQKRILKIFLQLLEGSAITKKDLMNQYEKKDSTIQRDMNIIESAIEEHEEEAFYQGKRSMEHLYEEKPEYFLKRDGKGTYQLNSSSKLKQSNPLTDDEILVLLKLLISTRVLNDNEMTIFYKKLLSMATDRKRLEQFIGNEKVYYKGVSNVDLLERIHFICDMILCNGKVEFEYSKNGNTEMIRRVPHAIYFSDMYFYMVSANQTGTDNATLSEMNKFRINNMVNLRAVSTGNKKEYKERFQGGLLRKQTNYAYFGTPITMEIEFYFDPVYILDRFPDSRILWEKDGVYRIEMNVNDGYGMKMWLLSQGDMLKIISPTYMREYVANDMIGTLEFYGYEIFKDGKRVHVKDLDS